MTFRTIGLGVLINFLLLNVALLSVQLVKCQPIKEKYISAFLYSKWSETPLLLETRFDDNKNWYILFIFLLLKSK